MGTKVFQYGALPPAKDGSIRQQMQLGREYYNSLVDAENMRRGKVWGAAECPKPPEHEHPKEGKCDICDAHYKPIREAYYAAEPVDVKPLRAEAVKQGLYWGTYLIIEEMFSAAWKKTRFILPVKYRSWRQGGIMGVQITRTSMPSTKFKIRAEVDQRKGYRKGRRHTMQIRVGTSEEAGAPVWSDPIKFEQHRFYTGRPAWAKICLKHIGDREVWKVNITCADVVDVADVANDSSVAIDVGWRVMPDDSVRLAYAHGSDGKDCELTMDARWRECGDRADRIKAERDKRMNELKEADHRFFNLKSAVSVARVAQEQEIDEPEITEWIKRDKHLRQYELGCRRRVAAIRKDKLRKWLSELRKLYKTAIIKDSSHKAMKDHKKAVEAGLTQQSRRNGHHGAPGEVVEEICRVFGRMENVAVVLAKDTTATCCEHGVHLDVDAGLTVHCERCNADLDRDFVSTRNMMDLFFAGKHQKPTARKTTARFAKRHKIAA